MALYENLSSFSYVSSAAIAQYRFVGGAGVAGMDRLCVHGTAGGLVLGVSMNDTRPDDAGLEAGQAITVVNNGIVKVEAGQNIAAGDVVASGVAGTAAVAATGNVAIGQAITNAAVGELVEVHWLGPWIAA